MIIKIQIIDNIQCKLINSEAKIVLDQLMSCDIQIYRPGAFHLIPDKKTHYFIDRKGIFLSGFLSRIYTYAQKKGHSIKLIDPEKMQFIDFNCYELPKIHYREDQLRLLKSAFDAQRGIIISPTGSGKTLLLAGLLKGFERARCLVIVPSLSILSQTADELKKLQFLEIGVISGTKKEHEGPIILATRQSIVKLKNNIDFMSTFSVIICDECHIGAGLRGQLFNILMHCDAPVRLGLTATLPNSKENKMNLEGLFGPILETAKIEELPNTLVQPKIKLISLPTIPAREINSFNSAYDKGIVNNKIRNTKIILEAKRLSSEGLTTLIFIERMEHGENLCLIADKFNLPYYFVKGETLINERDEIKEKLMNGTIRIVISSRVWREGVNIPSLNAVILAAGGKSNAGIIQTIGRGLRKIPGKDTAIIIDFLDTGRYLAEHCIERLKLYNDLSWL